jgi:hypothetical protein
MVSGCAEATKEKTARQSLPFDLVVTYFPAQ